MRDEYFEKQAARARQRAELVIANPNFQKDVISLRNKLKIPVSGFKDDESNREWHKKFEASDDEYFDTVWMEKRFEIEKLRKAKKFKESEDLQKELNNAAPVNSFRISIKKILGKYKLPLRWEESVRRYVLFNNIDLMWLPGGVTIHGERDKDTDLEKLWIGIEDDTRIEDIIEAWPEIKFQQKQLHSYKNEKFQPIRNFDRDKEAYDLKESGKKYTEIAKTLSRKYNKIYGYEDVGSFIKRHKQKVGIN